MHSLADMGKTLVRLENASFCWGGGGGGGLIIFFGGEGQD